MSEQLQQLNIKVTIDGKEGIVTLGLTNDQVKNLTASVNTLAAQNSTVFSQITNEILKYNNVTDESVATVSQWISSVGLSKKVVEDYIRSLNRENETLNVNTEKFHQNEVVIANLSKGLAASIQQHGAFANKTNLTTSQLLKQNDAFNRGKFGVSQLGYALGDASTFAIDFRIGMMAIGNNLPFVIQGMQEMKTAAAETGKTFSQVLRNAIVGPVGVILAVNLLMTIIQVLIPLLTKTKEKTKDLATETENYAQKLKDLAVVELELERQRLERDKREKERLIKSIQASGKIIPSMKTEGFRIEYPPGEAKKLKDAQQDIESIIKNLSALEEIIPDAQKNLTQILMGSYDLSSIKNIQGAIKTLNKEFEGAQDQKYRDFLKARIEGLEKVEQDYRGEKDKSETDLAKKRESLEKEVLAKANDGRQRDLIELKQWYDERKKIAGNNLTILSNLDAAYSLKQKEINEKYDKKIREEIIAGFEQRIRYNELSGISIKDLVNEEIKYIEGTLKKEGISLELVNSLTQKKIELQQKLRNLLQPTGEVKVPGKPKDPLGGMTTEEIRSQNFELAIMDALTSSVTSGFENAGRAMAGAAASSIRLFSQANSLLQVFIQSLIRAIAQALILKAVTALLNLIPGFGTAASVGASAAASAVPGLASGGVITRPTLAMIGEGREPEGVFPLSQLSRFINTQQRSGGSQTLKIIMDPVEIIGEAKSLRATLARYEASLRTSR